jgi:Leucine-rich repeat (LRR) protein
MLRSILALAFFGLLSAACDDTGSPSPPSWRTTAAPKPDAAASATGSALAAVGDAAALPVAPKRKNPADCKVSDTIEFTDKVMEQAVKFALQVDGGMPDKVKKSDLANIKTLNLARYGKSPELDVCLVPLMTGLKEIVFKGDADDLSAVVGLQNLELITASFSKISDLTPLSGLGKLKAIDVSHSLVVNLQALERLTNLTKLVIDGDTGIEDLAPISGCIKLESLSMAKTGVTNLGPLSQLKLLKSIDISGSPVTDLSPISGQKAHGLKIIK